jgi:hypothetical protein
MMGSWTAHVGSASFQIILESPHRRWISVTIALQQVLSDQLSNLLIGRIICAFYQRSHLFLVTIGDLAYEARRHQIAATFDNLAEFAQKEGSYFVFAHVLAPHPPFIFDAGGNPKTNWRPFGIADGSHWAGRLGTRSGYIAGYRSQIQHISSLLMGAIEEILRNSEIPPIIIVQAHHGPGAYFDWNSIERTDLTERIGILNACHLPGCDAGCLYPGIKPVNSLRMCSRALLTE